MRKILLLFVSLCTYCCLFAATPQSEIVFEKTVHNFGKFSESNPKQTCKFAFKNTGDAPLIINQAIASCGCTVPSYTKEPIKPGEKGEISVTYNATGRYPGLFKKSITVKTNAKQSLIRLYIEGEMIAAQK